ncbi:MAG: KpsF/GutQ family sugar-phosphate isomerase [Candidatus Sabulitectum sp.]|nr:KpsF/GutQ family sugar-phosphate isomerase [Candidatus Sabulitectum sp.]
MSDLFLEAERVFNIEVEWLQATLLLNRKSFTGAAELIFQSKGKIIVCGMGKSGLVARKIAATMTSTGTPSYFLHPADGIHGDAGILARGDTALVLSKSGDTAEIAALLPVLRSLDISVVAIVGKEDSLLGRFADVVLKLPALKEACPYDLAPTASTTAMMTLGDALAMSLLKLSGFTPLDFAEVHPGGSLGKKLLMRVSDIMVTGKLPVLLSGSLLSQAIEVMTEHRGLCIAVDAEQKLEGIFVYGDLGRLMRDRVDVAELFLKDVMIKDPAATSSHELLALAVQTMEEKGITSLVVLNDALQPQGVVYLHDALALGF